MNWWLAAVLCTTAAWRAAGQGEFQFNNRIPGTVVAPVTFLDGTPVGRDHGFIAAVWAGPEGTPSSELVSLIPMTMLRSGRAAGFVNPIAYAVPGVPAGARATLIMQVFSGAT